MGDRPPFEFYPGVWRGWGCLWMMALPGGDVHAIWFTHHGTAFAHCPEIVTQFKDAYGVTVPSGTMCRTCGTILVSHHVDPLSTDEMYEFVTSGTPVALWSCGRIGTDGACETVGLGSGVMPVWEP